MSAANAEQLIKLIIGNFRRNQPKSRLFVVHHSLYLPYHHGEKTK